MDASHTAVAADAHDGTARHGQQKLNKSEAPGQFAARPLWEHSSPHAVPQKEEHGNLVGSKAQHDLGIDNGGSSRLYDEGGMEHENQGHVANPHKLEKRRLHKQKQRANFSAKLESYMKILRRG